MGRHRYCIPVKQAFSYPSGKDDDTDEDCDRNEVKIRHGNDDYGSRTKPKDDDDDDDDDDTDDYDKCYEVLTRGPCEETEIVLMDPVTRKVRNNGMMYQ